MQPEPGEDPTTVVLPAPGQPSGPNQIREETRAVYYFENPVREALGLPLRTSYFKENDVIDVWGAASRGVK
jgi:hypothetical protein